MDPHFCKRYSGFSHKTSPLCPQTHRTVTVTVTVRVVILTETLIIILSKITYLAVSIRISKHIYRTTDVIFELITKIWMLFSTMLTSSWTRYSWINEISFNGKKYRGTHRAWSFTLCPKLLFTTYRHFIWCC